MITGVLTAVAGASAKTELCATPSPGLATVLQATADGAARTAVNRVPTGMTVTRDVSARMERPATISLGNAVVHRDTLGPCKLMSRGAAPQILCASTSIVPLIALAGLGSRYHWMATRACYCLTSQCWSSANVSYKGIYVISQYITSRLTGWWVNEYIWGLSQQVWISVTDFPQFHSPSRNS